jgi:hypothetical protein
MPCHQGFDPLVDGAVGNVICPLARRAEGPVAQPVLRVHPVGPVRACDGLTAAGQDRAEEDPHQPGGLNRDRGPRRDERTTGTRSRPGAMMSWQASYGFVFRPMCRLTKGSSFGYHKTWTLACHLLHCFELRSHCVCRGWGRLEGHGASQQLVRLQPPLKRQVCAAYYAGK